MADPISWGTLGTLALGSLIGGGGALAANAFSSSGSGAPAPPAALPPQPTTPAQAPQAKPAPKHPQQQSFLSGAAQLQNQGAAGTGSKFGGKTLLGQ